MPYRRLPNTDAARLRALSQPINKTMSMHPDDIPFSYQLLQRIKAFITTFQRGVNRSREEYSQSINQNSEFTNLQKKARIYISHFIQSLIMTIEREELPEQVKNYYNLQKGSKKIPSLITNEDIITWGNAIIKGEEKRVQEGGNPLANPRIAMVKIHFDNFMRASQSQSFTHGKIERNFEYIHELRTTADSIILDLWNEIEEYYSNLEPKEKRKHAREYGVVYVFRKHEIPDEDE